MANIKKTFNFRNGVQVDDDNLIVNQTGLVGIGTTIPTEALDVRGTAKIVGLVTATSANIGVLTVTTVDITGQQTISGGLVGSGVSIKSGVITATDPTGIVTFYGDARYLQGMPTSQWLDKDVGLGYSSIYNAGGNVGIHTNDPRYGLQIGGNNDIDNFAEGVGINTTGSIFATGIITATSFVGAIAGPVTGNVVGNVTGNLNSTGVSTIGSLKITNINITGLSTHRVPFTDATDNIVDSDDLTFNNNSNVLNIVGTTDTDQLNVSGVSTLGVSTFTSTVSFGATSSFNDNSKLRFGDGGDLSIYHTTSSGGYSAIVDEGTGQLIIGSNLLEVKNAALNQTYATFTGGQGVDLNYNTTKRFATSGVGVTVYNQLDTTNIEAAGSLVVGAGISAIGIITATTELNSPLVGVGTDDPQTDIQVRKPNAAQIRVSSDTDAAVVSVGREPGAGNANNAFIRYGNTSAAYPYSSPTSFDIVNNGAGSVNFHLSANNASAAIGDFNWHKGTNNDRLMTLTKGGRLGIGITVPTQPLDVQGNARFTGALTFVSGNASGTVTANAFSGSLTGNVTGNVTGTLLGNVNSTAGVSTFKQAYITNGVGIGTTASEDLVNIGDNADKKVFIEGDGRIGIGTDTFSTNQVGVEVRKDVRIHFGLGVGNTARSSVDFSDVVSMSGAAQRAKLAYMIPPKVTTSQRNAFIDGWTQSTTITAGAMIFNTDAGKLQVWTGSAWENLH